MRREENIFRWILFGLLGIPAPLITYFYLILHLGFRISYHDLAMPAVVFCVSSMLFAVGLFWGTGARSRGDSRPICLVTGLFLLLCLAEVKYFNLIVRTTSHSTAIASYVGITIFVFFCTLLAYLFDRRWPKAQ